MASSPSTSAAVLCRGLVKRFGTVTAVNGLDLDVRRGECFGMLGPNGAGKTTTVEILEGLTQADAGDVEVLGERWHGDGLALRGRLGVQLQETKFPEKLQVAEVMALFRASRLGVIAGCMVTRGVIRRNSQIRVVREGAVVYETTIASLKRFKDDVREVQEGFECGILLENFNDVKEGDILEAYETRQIERTDLDVPAGAAVPSAEEAVEEA